MAKDFDLNNLWQYSSYLTGADYIIGQPIIELDISKANISIARWKGAISESDYWNLFNAPKINREIEFGKMQKANPELTKMLQRGLAEFRHMLFDLFGINYYNLVQVRNDAIFFVSPGLSFKTSIPGFVMNVEHGPMGDRPAIFYNHGNGEIGVRVDGNFTSFYKINKLVLLYNNGRFYPEVLEVAGISNENCELHKYFILDFLCTIFQSVELLGVEQAISVLRVFYDKYINRQLSIGYYRSFNAASVYHLRNLSNYADFQAKMLPETAINDIDISYNARVLSDLQKILGTVYFNTKK